MPENDNEFMNRLMKVAQEKADAAQDRNIETKVLKLVPGKLYKFKVVRSWGVKSNKYGDSMGFSFENSPVCKDYDGEENAFYLRGGQMRTFRERVLRDIADNPAFPELDTGYDVDEPITTTVPKLDNPVMVEFVIDEAKPEAGRTHGFMQIYGKTVDSFSEKWEAPAKFVKEMRKEMDDYIASRKKTDEGKKLGHKELGVNTPIHIHLVDAFANKDEEGNRFVIFKIDPAKSELGGNLKKGDYNRLHLSGVTLKSFLRILSLPAKDGTEAVQVGFDEEKKKPELVNVPAIPEGGVEVRFFRRERKGENYSYKECLGEKL